MPATTSRSGLSIRRLVSQRRTRNEKEHLGQLDSDSSTDLPSSYPGSRESWLPSRHRSRRRPSTPIPTRENIHDVLGPLPPLPNETPRSSASSLCSCENRHDFGSRPSFGLGRSTLCPASPKKSQSDESLQLSATSSRGNDSIPQIQVEDHTGSPVPLNHHEETSPHSTGTPHRRHSEDTGNGSKERPGNHAPFSMFSDNVQQLIQEADEAFKAVGNALAEVKISQGSFKEKTSMESFKEAPQPTAFKDMASLPTPDLSPILQSPFGGSSQKSESSSRIPASRSPNRDSTGGKPKRKKSKKTKAKAPKQMKPQRKAATMKQMSKQGPRWTLTENVSELFSGKLFHKIEVDEMLTPGQLEAYKLRRMSQLQSQTQLQTQAQQPQKSSESLHTAKSEGDEVDTPVEPFHLEDLPSRIGSAGVKLAEDAPADDRLATAATADEVEHRDFSLRQEENELPATPPSAHVSRHAPPTPPKNTPISPTARSPARLGGGRKPLAVLSAIPEVSNAPSPNDESVFDSKFFGTQDSVADYKYVFLQSSPRTATVPTFRHGPIRLAKSDLVPEPDPKLGADDGLDWIAFQMAILGGAGDWNSDSDDTIRHQQTEEVADILGWWNSWSLGGPGVLVTEELEASSPTSTLSGEEFSDVSYSDIKHDNPYNDHHKWEDLQRQAAAKGRYLGRCTLPATASEYHGDYENTQELEAHKFYVGGPDETWSQPRKFTERDSITSLPQSPMLDLRVIRSPAGDDADVVPMGYNLGHDLGDFLKWEAENAYAGGF